MGLYVLFLIVLVGAAFVWGRQHALALVERPRQLHSLPRIYGIWLALTTTLPSFILLAVYALLHPLILQHIVFQKLGTALENLSLPQRGALWSDIKLLATGSAANFPDALRSSGAMLYVHYDRMALMALSAVLVILIFGGFAFGWSRIKPQFRARHRVETFLKVLLFLSSGVAVLTTLGIVLSLIGESVRFFSVVSPVDFLFGLNWTPQQMAFRADQVGGTAAFGIVPLITGTLLITCIAMLVAAPLGLMAAIYLTEYASPRFRSVGKPVLELLAGIPTVVYGFFAALTVAPLIRDFGQSLHLDVSSESALAAGLVMGIMIVPFVSSLSDDVINAVPQSLRDGSMGLGATHSETIRHVVLPAALPGIVSALLLAISRAIGETMIVLMAAGLAANLTFNPLNAVTTFTVQIGTLLTGDQEFDSPKTLSAFALGLVLFTMTLILNLIALRVVKSYSERYE